MRSSVLAMGAAVCFTANVARAGEPTIDRQGSHLVVTWDAPDSGNWRLTDSDGNPCADGSHDAGAARIDLPAVAAPTDLTLTLDNRSFAIPGVKHISPLTKPAGAAVIYQLEPRTYFATDVGKDKSGHLSDLTDTRLAEIKDLGADYLWLTGILEHAALTQTDPDVVKGQAGSYYAIYDSWNVATELGTLADFEALIDRAHAAGLRVLIDFVPNHTARQHRTSVACKAHLDFGRADQAGNGFDPQNNYYYIEGQTFAPPYVPNCPGCDGQFDTDIFTAGIQLENPARVTGNDVVSATPSTSDWYETAKLNYGWDLASKTAHYDPRPRTWDQMIDVARYWTMKGVDGFRVDFAHPVPIEFWRVFAQELKAVQPEIFLLAEAYETDNAMKLPGFSYYNLFDAGFDAIYDSDLFWAMTGQVQRPGNMRSATASHSPALAPDIVSRGFQFTHYMENHDEVRVASRFFAPFIADRGARANLGLAYVAYLALMPGHLLLHGGQELQEDASVFGPYAGDNGHTSIFDYVYQAQTRIWNQGPRPQSMSDFRARYQALVALKKSPAFSAPHSANAPSLIDLDGANANATESQWVASYVRFAGGDAYVVVVNSDPQVAHEATVHFTTQTNADTLGALAALGIDNSDRRYVFTEVFSRPGWVPTDPAIQGAGLPGWMMYQPGAVPSGLYLGQVPAATTYVFKVTPL